MMDAAARVCTHAHTRAQMVPHCPTLPDRTTDLQSLACLGDPSPPRESPLSYPTLTPTVAKGSLRRLPVSLKLHEASRVDSQVAGARQWEESGGHTHLHSQHSG